MFSKANGLVGVLERYFITLKPAIDTLMNSESIAGVVAFAELIGITLGAYLIFVLIGQKLYFKGVIGNSAGAHVKPRKTLINSNFKMKKVGIRYVGKELKILFRNPIYFMQCVLPAFIMPVLYIGIIFFGGQVGEIISAMEGVNINSSIFVCVVMAIIQFICMMNFIAITAISRDGESAVFTKYVPVSMYKQFLYKIIPAIIISAVPVVIVLALAKYLYSGISIFNLVSLMAISMIINVLQSYLMFIVDLKRPKLHWDSEYAVVKQNMNMMFEFILGFVVLGLLVLMAFIFKDLYYAIPIGVIAVLAGISVLLIDKYVDKAQNELFEKVV